MWNTFTNFGITISLHTRDKALNQHDICYMSRYFLDLNIIDLVKQNESKGLMHAVI